MEQCANPQTVESLTEALRTELTERGLAADVYGSMVWAANRAADPPGEDPRAVQLSPGMRQAVVCRPDPEGALLWWWIWPAFRDNLPADMEPLGPATDVTTAADRIIRVLRLND